MAKTYNRGGLFVCPFLENKEIVPFGRSKLQKAEKTEFKTFGRIVSTLGKNDCNFVFFIIIVIRLLIVRLLNKSCFLNWNL